MFKFPRTEERYVVKDTIYVEVVGDGFYDRFRARDISANGISIFVKYDFQGIDLNKEVDLHITLPGQKAFKAIGQIRHRGLGKDHYFGIRLISMDSHSRALLNDYLSKLS